MAGTHFPCFVVMKKELNSNLGLLFFPQFFLLHPSRPFFVFVWVWFSNFAYRFILSQWTHVWCVRLRDFLHTSTMCIYVHTCIYIWQKMDPIDKCNLCCWRQPNFLSKYEIALLEFILWKLYKIITYYIFICSRGLIFLPFIFIYFHGFYSNVSPMPGYKLFIM